MVGMVLALLQIFIAIAKTGSKTAEGEHIALSQSAVSASIGELERTLNTQLFDRIGKRLLLNDYRQTKLLQAMALVNRMRLTQVSLLNSIPCLVFLAVSLAF